MLSKKVKARIARNKLRRACRHPVEVQVAESDTTHRLPDLKLPEGGFWRGQLVIFSAHGRSRGPAQLSPHTFEMGDGEVSIVHPDRG